MGFGGRSHRWVAAVAVALISGIVIPAGTAGAARSAGSGVGRAPDQPAGGERQVTVTPLTTETGEPLDGSYLELNERGQVAATLYRTEPLESVVVLWHRGRVTRVSPEGVYAHPTDLSDRGHVVGEIYALDQAQGGWSWPIHPFWWWRGEWVRPSTTHIGGRGGLDVNRRGQVVLPLDAPPYSGIWDGGEVIPSPPDTWAQLVNDRGQIMGRVANPTRQTEAATWRIGDDRVTRLGTLGGDYSEGVAINEAGAIAGNSGTADGEQHAFLWRGGEMIDLGTLGGVGSRVTDLNDRGDVVGTSGTADGEQHAFLWRGGEMIDLGSLGGRNVHPSSVAVAVNDRGQVVGYSARPDGEEHVVLWEDGRMTDIGALVGDNGSRPVDINDRGQILVQVSGGGAALWTVAPRRQLGPGG